MAHFGFSYWALTRQVDFCHYRGPQRLNCWDLDNLISCGELKVVD